MNDTTNTNGLGGIGLFPRMSEFKSDLGDFALLGAGAFGGNIGWGYVEKTIAGFIPASLAQYGKYILPALQVVTGVVVGAAVAKRGSKMKWLGYGVGAGLVGGGTLKLINAVQPGLLPVAGLGYDPLLMAGVSGASLDVESPSRFVASPNNFQGAQLSIDAPSKFGGIGGTNAGVASVLS